MNETKGRSALFWVVIVFIVGFFATSIFSILGFTSMVKTLVASDSKIYKAASGNLAVVEIEGIIESSYQVLTELKEVSENNHIKAVVVRINSPGGAVGSSQEIFQAIKELSESKTVVCSMGDIAASGGFYIAMGCPKIIANPGTLTGSIGVIMQFMNMEGLFSWAKMQPFVIKAGTFKDVGNPSRSMRDDEKELLQGMINEVHQQFRQDIMSQRKLSEQDLENVADGRIFSGEQAKKLNLIDSLGGEHDAIKLAAQLADIKGKPSILRPSRSKNKIEKFLENSQLNILQQLPPVQSLKLVPGIPYLLPPHMFSGGVKQ